MQVIKVLIVDDHPTVRRGLDSLLTSHPDIDVVGEAEEGATALRLAESLNPDIILLDIQMPRLDGIGVANQLRRIVPNAKIIALTAFENDEYVVSALRAGAYAYLLKSNTDEFIVETIRRVHQGERLLSPSVLSGVLRRFQDLAQEHAVQESGLTEEELKVLALLGGGDTNEEIAKKMFWSERTVMRKVEEILEKMNVKNRTQAVAEAIKRGLI
jgi:DNA-binding NarL/FixJ family response regulator